MPPIVDNITIPAKSIALLGTASSYTLRMRTHSQDSTTRFFSDTRTFLTTDIPVQPDKDGWVVVNGTVTFKGSPVCAMVLINGQYMFSCSGDGSFELKVPLDESGQITVQAFCDGLSPFRQTIEPSQGFGLQIDMDLADAIKDLEINYTTELVKSGWVKIKGTVTYNGSPVCAMVLANGQYMFTCTGDGSFELTSPLDGDGQITLFGFCSGFSPFKAIFDSSGSGVGVEQTLDQGIIGVWDMSQAENQMIEKSYLHFSSDGNFIHEVSSYFGKNGSIDFVNNPLFVYGRYQYDGNTLTIEPDYAVNKDGNVVPDGDIDICWPSSPGNSVVSIIGLYKKMNPSTFIEELTLKAGATITQSPPNDCDGNALPVEMTMATKYSDNPGNLVLK
jgi:hypothetical protein